MRELLNRLEKLEARAAPIEPIRIVWHVIDVLPGGGAVPFNPTIAHCQRLERQGLERKASETPDDFERRALAAFPDAALVLA